MKISQLITLLQDAKKEVGDLEVALASDPEVNRLGELDVRRWAGLESLVKAGGTLSLSDNPEYDDPTHLVIIPITSHEVF